MRNARAALPAVFAMLAAGLLITVRYDIGRDRSFAGPADLSFYFTLSKKIFNGEGLSINYVWHFLQPWNTVTHPANDYWLPLTSVFIAGGFWLTGAADLHSALIMPGLAWLMIGIVVFLLARQLSLSIVESVWAALVALTTPFLLERSLLTDTAIFASLFGSIAIILCACTADDLRWCPLACVSIAVTYLIRQDGILLWSGVAVAVLWNRASAADRMKWFGGGVVVFIACCVPIWIVNERTIGSLLPTAPIRSAFFTRYEDVYSYDKALTLRTYLAAGPSLIILSKLKMLAVEVFQLPQLLGWSLLVSVVAVAVPAAKRSVLALPRSFRIAAVVATAQFAFYALVATFPAGPGGFARAFGAIIPLIATGVAYGVASFVRHRSMRLSILAAIALLNLAGGVPALEHRFGVMDARAREFKVAGDWLLERQTQAGMVPVVMKREPWEFSELTSLPSVQIPSDGLNAICRVARKFNASVILGPAPERPELDRALAAGDRRFFLWEPVPRTTLAFLRIEAGCRELWQEGKGATSAR